MKIVVAVDSFKGSASSVELNETVAKAIISVLPSARVEKFPIADGGEGTLEALAAALGGVWVSAKTVDLMGRPIVATYLQVGQQAFIESACVVGIDKISPSSTTFAKASSFGLGALIVDAVERGCREIYVTLGGSGTSDGGLGLLRSFGFDRQGFDFTFPNHWEEVKLVGWTDVRNVYAGETGFAKVFGQQKGGNPEQIAFNNQEALAFCQLVQTEMGIDLLSIAGTGAAGGLGGAIVLLGGHLESGFERIARTIGLEKVIRDANLVITGEGRLDGQSKEGKVPFGLARLAKKYGVPTIAVCGAIADRADWLREDFLSVFSIQTEVLTLEETMKKERTLSQLDFVIKNIVRTYIR